MVAIPQILWRVFSTHKNILHQHDHQMKSVCPVLPSSLPSNVHCKVKGTQDPVSHLVVTSLWSPCRGGISQSFIKKKVLFPY